MVSRNNQWYKLQQGMEQVPHFGIRKLTVGVSSVLLGLSFMGINMTTVHADNATLAMTSASQVAAQGTTTTANTGEKANPETAQSTDETNVATTSLNVNSTAATTANLQESKAQSTELQAQNVNTDLIHYGRPLDKITNWDSSSWTSYGYKGQFSIPYQDLVNGTTINVGNFTVDSNNGKYMFFTGDGGTHRINYVDPQSGETINDLGFMWFQGGYNNGKIIFKVNKTIFDVNKNANEVNKLITINFDIKDFVIVNYFTDRHIFKGATQQNPYVENIHFADKTYTFHVVPKIYTPLESYNSVVFVPYGQTDSGALQNYAWDSLIKDQQTFKELQESQGQRGNVTIPQTFKYYYRVTVKDPSDLANYGFHNPRVDFFTNAHVINSDGQMTQETKQLGGDSVRLSKAADNQNFDQLDTLVGNDGAVWSKQADGSYLFVIHISPDVVRKAAKVTQSMSDTNTVVFDKDEAKANAAINHFYHDGVLKDLPDCIIPEIRIDYNNYRTTAPSYTMQIMEKRGNSYVDVLNGSMSPVVDTSNTQGQAGITIHYLNGQTGELMDGTTVQTNFGEPGHQMIVSVPSVPGYQVRTNVNGNIKFDNGAAQTVKDGDTVISGTNQQITLPGADKIANVYVVYDGEPRVATVKYVDVDDNYKVLHTDTIHGKVGQTQSYSTANEISKHAHYHVQKDELTDTNAQKGITGISFDATDEPQEYTVYLKHDTKQTDTPKTVKETIDYQYENGSKVADSVAKSATLVHHVTTDLVTNQNIDDHWDDPMFLAEVSSPKIDGYTPSQSKVEQMLVNKDVKDKHVTVTYLADAQKITVNYVDEQTGKVLSTKTLNGHSDQNANYSTKEAVAGYEKQGYTLTSDETNGATLVFDHDDNADQSYTVKFNHRTITITPDKPQNSGTTIPGTNHTFPQGVAKDDLNKTITRTIEVLDPHTGKTTTTQTVHLTRQATVDEVTRQVTYGDWTTGEWDEFTVPAVAGYTPSESMVAGQTVTDQTNDTTVTITYTANEQTTNIIYRDKDGKTIKTDSVNGKTDQTVKTNSEVPAGWEVVPGEKPAPSEIKFTGDHTPDTIITIQHKHDIVNPGDDQPTGPLPGDKDRDYPQLEELTRNVHFTVRITDPRTGEVTTKAQEADYVRQADIDEVTGDVTYSDWKPAAAETSADAETPQAQSFADVVVPTIQGYTAHSHRSHAASDELRLFKAQTGDESVDTDLAVDPDGSVKVKGDSNVTADTPDRLVEVTYTANPQSGKIIYVDPNGNPIVETPIQGVTDQTIPFTPQIPAGYELVPGQTIPTEITFNGDGQPVVIKVEIEKIPTRNNRSGNGQANGDYYNGTRLENDGSQANVNTAGQHQTNDQQLPQTGDENSSALVGLGLMGITLGMFGLKKKEDN